MSSCLLGSVRSAYTHLDELLQHSGALCVRQQNLPQPGAQVDFLAKVLPERVLLHVVITPGPEICAESSCLLADCACWACCQLPATLCVCVCVSPSLALSCHTTALRELHKPSKTVLYLQSTGLLVVCSTFSQAHISRACIWRYQEADHDYTGHSAAAAVLQPSSSRTYAKQLAQLRASEPAPSSTLSESRS